METKPARYRPILTIENAKTIKGEKLGYLTGICYLAPANEAGLGNLCPMSTPGCRRDCLFTAGRGQFEAVRAARIAKTAFYFRDRLAFEASLEYDIAALVRRARTLGLTPAVRINGTSDLPKLALRCAHKFPKVQFYDYTKLPRAWQRTRKNYHLTFSHSERNERDCLAALKHGINVAVVFNTRRSQELPTYWQGYPVLDGDLHDLRFLDPKRHVVGLRAKGLARQDTNSGFVVLT